MELSDYIRTLRKRWRIAALCTLLALSAAGAASLLVTPVYEAETRLFVSTQNSGGISELQQGGTFTQQRVKSYADIVTSPRVLEPVVDALGLDTTPRDLAETVTAQAPLDTVLISVMVRNTDPEQAAQIANAIGLQFITVVGELERPEGSDTSPVNVSVVEEAETPTSPVEPRTLVNLTLGLLIGLAVGVGAAVLRETLDTTVKSQRDIEAVTDASIIGAIGFDPDAPKRPLIVHVDPHSQRAEAFRQLRTNLQFIDVDHQKRSIVVTSSVPGEGKSTTAVNLAITMAASGLRVAIVEGDLRRPRIAEYLGIEGAAGLTSVLIGRAELDDVLQPWGQDGLLVLPAGPIPPNPSELLGSHQMRELLSTLQDQVDVLLIDTPPLLPVTDAAILSRLASGAVLVAGAGRIRREELARALGNLAAVDAKVLGIVLNLAATKGPDADSYGYGYGYAPSDAIPEPAAPAREPVGTRGRFPFGRRRGNG